MKTIVQIPVTTIFLYLCCISMGSVINCALSSRGYQYGSMVTSDAGVADKTVDGDTATPPIPEIRLSRLSKVKHHGDPWDDADNVFVDKNGIAVLMDNEYHWELLRLTAANTVRYTLTFYSHSREMASRYVEHFRNPDDTAPDYKLLSHVLHVPREVHIMGYDKIVIHAIGDTVGSIGHIEHLSRFSSFKNGKYYSNLYFGPEGAMKINPNMPIIEYDNNGNKLREIYKWVEYEQ